MNSTNYLEEAPGNWSEEEITSLLDVAYSSVSASMEDQNLRGKIIRKKRAVGLVPLPGETIPREALDETVLRCQGDLTRMHDGRGPDLPFCAFNGGRDMWTDVGNKRVGVKVLQSYLGNRPVETLHIGDQFLNTGNDYAARDVCPCIWITSPEETTYILKTILRLAGVSLNEDSVVAASSDSKKLERAPEDKKPSSVDFTEMERRSKAVEMDVYTGEIKQS